MLIVYKISHKESDNSYIGSTKNLNARIQKHHDNMRAKDKCHFKLYQFIKENGNWENFEFSILANIDIEIGDICKKEVLEQRYIDKYLPTLNQKRAYLSDEQRREIKRQYNLTYGLHEVECVCGSKYKFKNSSKHRKTLRHIDFCKKQPIILKFE